MSTFFLPIRYIHSNLEILPNFMPFTGNGHFDEFFQKILLTKKNQKTSFLSTCYSVMPQPIEKSFSVIP